MYLQLQILGILLFVAININAQCCENYCYDYDREKPQSRHFASKTAYEIIKGDESNRPYFLPYCKPVKIWFLIRHGTRLPDKSDMDNLKKLAYLRDEIIDNYEKRNNKPDKGALCDADLKLLQHWKWNTNITSLYPKYLTEQGWDDMKFLALFYQRALPNLFDNIHSQDKFLFRYTNRQRTEASYKAFAEGLFGENAYKYIQATPPPSKDYLLKPYKACKLWKKNSKNLESDPNTEYAKFRNSTIFQKLIKDVSLRLGFKFTLDITKIDLIWDMCRYDFAWRLDFSSPWCSAFTPAQVDILEYNNDLKDYYENGYGYALNNNIACFTVKDMLEHLDSNSQPKSIVYFTHSSLLLLMLTALGANKDREALRSDNYLQMKYRQFQTSDLSPFAANLAVIKYDCPNDPERYKIKFFLNQKGFDFEWCINVCNWSDLKKRFAKFQTADCAQTFCNLNASKINKFSVIFLLLSEAVIIFRYFCY